MACIMLNQTSAKQVWPVLPKFFEQWPDALGASLSPLDEMADVLRPLGLQNRRAVIIRAMSHMYAEHNFDDVTDLPGVGKYAADSYKIFVQKQLIEDVEDKELLRYVRWAKERGPDKDAGVSDGV